MKLPSFLSTLILLSIFPNLSAFQNTTSINRHENEYLKLQLTHIPRPTSPSQIPLFDTHRPNLKSPLISGAYAGVGQYFAGISIGTPAQHLLLVVDTGSDLTWVKCSACRDDCPAKHPPDSTFLARHSSSFLNVPCRHPICRHHVPGPGCRVGSRACYFESSYTDGSLSSGLFSRETASLNSSSGRVIRIPGVKFGCGFHVSGPSVNPAGFEGASGVMGLGRGPLSFSAQLGKKFGNKFSYCLMDYTLSPPPTSYLVIGGGSDDVVSGSDSIQSTPLIISTLSPTFYYIGIKGVVIDGEKLPISPSVWQLDDSGNGGTIIDTGTTLSFMPEPAYRAILSAMRKRVRMPRLSAELTQAQGFDLCYNVSGVGKPRFPRMRYELVGDSVFRPPASNYFIDTAEGVSCLAMQAVNTPLGFGVIGNLMQQGFLFEFDNERSRLSFTRKGCGFQ